MVWYNFPFNDDNIDNTLNYVCAQMHVLYFEHSFSKKTFVSFEFIK